MIEKASWFNTKSADYNLTSHELTRAANRFLTDTGTCHNLSPVTCLASTHWAFRNKTAVQSQLTSPRFPNFYYSTSLPRRLPESSQPPIFLPWSVLLEHAPPSPLNLLNFLLAVSMTTTMDLMLTSTPKASLFSSSPPKKVRGFLGFPGEIRNQIYHYHFQGGFRCEIAAKDVSFDCNKPKVMKLCIGIINKNGPLHKYQGRPMPDIPTTIRISRRLGHYLRIHGIQTSWLSSLCGLILVCKKVHFETLVFLYQKTAFVFAAPRRIVNFLQVLPKINLSYITKLHLHYITFGDPKRLADRVWQEKHHASWVNACKMASKKLINLQELEVWLKVNASPLCFNLRQSWLEPLLQFRRLTWARNTRRNPGPTITIPQTPRPCPPLQVVKVNFKSYWTNHYALSRNAVPALADANIDLHHIFAQAISQAILGASEEEAMSDFKRAWEEKYQQWHHHLGFSYTGW